MENFLQLDVWHKAKSFVCMVYKLTDIFPDTEKFGLISQMRRAAVSVMANIAEGSKKKSIKEKKYFYEIADTSLEEVKSYFYLAYDLKYITQEQGEQLIKVAREVGGMLCQLIKNLKY
jgi:four helix bundle protein